MKRKFGPVHPGEILLEEFLKPMGITQYPLAKDINVPPHQINEILHGHRAISLIPHYACHVSLACLKHFE
jgi:antitoxin HigA-1